MLFKTDFLFFTFSFLFFSLRFVFHLINSFTFFPFNCLGFAPPTQGSTKNDKAREYFFSYSNGKSIVRVGNLNNNERPDPRNHYWVWTGPTGKYPNSVIVRGRTLRNCKGFIHDQISHASYETKIAKDVHILHVSLFFLFLLF